MGDPNDEELDTEFIIDEFIPRYISPLHYVVPSSVVQGGQNFTLYGEDGSVSLRITPARALAATTSFAQHCVVSRRSRDKRLEKQLESLDDISSVEEGALVPSPL